MVLDVIVGGVTYALVRVFTPGAALVMAAVILASAAVVCIYFSRRNSAILSALSSVNIALNPVREASNNDESHRAFKANYDAIATAVRVSGSEPLKRAWSELEESIVDLQADTLRNTVRPDEFFYHLAERSRGLLWWANIAVAVGLVLTFLGIIAALSSTAAAISTSATSTAMQGALQQLLGVTAAKFMTSAAGVLASIALRSWDVHLQRTVREALSQFTDGLERGLAYLPPQRLAAQQLDSLKQIETAQTRFATELATAIGDKFNEQMTPMIKILGTIDSSIQGLKQDMTDGLSKSIGESISTSAGKEMEMLAGALSAMSERLGAVPERLSASADDANSRIEAAAQLFSTASAGMSAAFDALGKKIESMGEAVIATQQQAFDGFAGQVRDATTAYGTASSENASAMTAAGEELKRLMTDIAGTIAALNGQMNAQAEAGTVAARNAVEETNKAMATASRAAAETLARAASDGAADAVRLSSEALEEVFARFTERFTIVGGAFNDRIDSSATKAQSLGGSLERAATSANSGADKLAQVSVAAERLGGLLTGSAAEVTATLNKAASSLSAAADPIRATSEAIADGVDSISDAIELQRTAALAQTEQWRAIASQFEATAAAAREAWQQYASRFEGVDDSLASALEQVTKASSEGATLLNNYARAMDDNIGNAVNRLAAVVDGLADLAPSGKSEKVA